MIVGLSYQLLKVGHGLEFSQLCAFGYRHQCAALWPEFICCVPVVKLVMVLCHVCVVTGVENQLSA